MLFVIMTGFFYPDNLIFLSGLIEFSVQFMLYILIIAVKLILFLSSLNFIALPQEVRGIFVIKAAVEMQNNLPFCD